MTKKLAGLPPVALSLILLVPLPVSAQAPEVVGTGATFPAKVYMQWATDYARQTGSPLTYQPAGSSAGVKAISERRVDFGATDVPLPQDELDKRGLFQFPTLVGGVVPFVNIPGLAAGALRLDAVTLARIWSGNIARWNDPAIHSLNPTLTLPDLAIQRVVRSDGSGTTAVFVDYLRKTAPTEAVAIIPDGGRARWPGTTLGADGSGKVVAMVKATPGAIGYASSDYALRENLNSVGLKNARGEYVKPSLAAFKAAIVAGALFKNSLEPTSLLNVDGVGVWPIVTATYVLVPREPASLERASRTLNFFYQSFLKGDAAVAGTEFAPLPTTTQARIVGLLSNFKTPSGQYIRVIGEQDIRTRLASNQPFQQRDNAGNKFLYGLPLNGKGLTDWGPWGSAPAVVYPASEVGSSMSRADMESASPRRHTLQTAGKLPEGLSA